jgi:hypothetical protein
MKKQIYTFVGLIIVLTISSVTATFAQSVRAMKADIPFDFSVRNQTVAAGNYMINQQDNNGLVWFLRNRDNRQSVILLAVGTESKKPSENGKLTFHRYGNKYFLTAIETPTYKIGLGKSRAQRNLEKRLENDRLAKYNEKGVTPEIVSINIEM